MRGGYPYHYGFGNRDAQNAGMPISLSHPARSTLRLLFNRVECFVFVFIYKWLDTIVFSDKKKTSEAPSPGNSLILFPVLTLVPICQLWALEMDREGRAPCIGSMSSVHAHPDCVGLYPVKLTSFSKP